MTDDISRLSDIELRSMLHNNRIVLTAVALGIRQPPGAGEAIHRLMKSRSV